MSESQWCKVMIKNSFDTQPGCRVDAPHLGLGHALLGVLANPEEGQVVVDNEREVPAKVNTTYSYI